MSNELWDIERRLWLEGENFFAEHMTEDAVMVFPEPVGILRGDAILQGLRGAPRWTSVDAANLEAVKRRDLAVLAKRAFGKSEGRAPYEALCMSTYERRRGDWRIAGHQQTPV